MTIREMIESFNKTNPAYQFAALNKNLNAFSSIFEKTAIDKMAEIMSKRSLEIEPIVYQSAIMNLSSITKALGVNNLTGLSNTIKAITEMNKAMAPTIAGLAQAQLTTAKSINPIINATRSILRSNEFQSTIQSIVNSDLTRGLAAFSKFAETISWDEDRLRHLFEDNYNDENNIEEKSETENNLVQVLFIALAFFTGQDFSTLMDEKKRNIFIAQLMFLALTLSDNQNICNSPSFIVNQVQIEKVICVASRGCVIRNGPGYGFKRIKAIPKGFISKKLEERDEWTKIEFYSLDSGISEGWIKTSLLLL